MAENEARAITAADQEDDTEGHAFKWDRVEDPKGGKRLRQGWEPE